MDNEPMTFSSLALIVILVILLLMFVCHFLGPNGNACWRSSKEEEKIGLSKNKLFHANGYMFPSGSEFLLSSSGSFKRFDTIDKDDHQKRADQPPPTAPPQHATTPLWNLPQTDTAIPPQPLRPAPAPQTPSSANNTTKSVTFSFTRLNEISPTADTPRPLNGEGINGQQPLVSCMRTIASPKRSSVPQPIEAPPAPRLSSSSSAIMSSTAIPRPVAKRQISLQNGLALLNGTAGSNGAAALGAHSGEQQLPTQPAQPKPQPRLTRRNSSTNPFLCESLESLTERCELPSIDTISHADGDHNDTDTALQSLQHQQNHQTTISTENTNHQEHSLSIASGAGLNGGCNGGSNPFYENVPDLSSTDELNLLALTDEDDSVGSAGEQQRGSRPPQQSAATFDQQRPPKMFNLRTTRSNIPEQLQQQCQQFRNRSFSETEASESDLKSFSSKLATKLNGTTNPFSGLSQKVQKGPHMLQKTISEDFLFRKLARANQSGANGPSQNVGGSGNTTWTFGRSLLRQDSAFSLSGRFNGSQGSLDGSMDNLERAVSCDSVNSDSSIFQCDLDQPYTQITGYLCVGLHYDKNSITDDGMELTVSVLEAKKLICPFKFESVDTFVRIYLVPDEAGAMQTKVVKDSTTPTFNESFNFWLRRQQGRHSLWFHLYHNGAAHTLIGEAEMEIGEMPRPITTWIPLSDSRKCNAKWGELMFSLSYLPTAERLTIVVVKGRNLKLEISPEGESGPAAPLEVQNIFVKVYLMNNEKKVLKKRTSLKRKDRCPIFNESMIFSVPPQGLTTVQLRLTVYGVVDGSNIVPIGHVIAGSCATGKGLRHWHQMLSSLRKPVAMWHVLRQATNQPVFTGGAEAVVAAMQRTALRTKRNSVV